MSANNNPEGKKPFFKQMLGGANEEMIEPMQIQNVHVDRAMVAVDYSTQTATVSLLTMHAVPTVSEKFKLDKFTYELIGELKVPFNTMDALCAYYLSTRTKDRKDCFNSIKKFLAEPPAVGTDFIVYGPTAME
jgi:hypothetical protein